MKSIFDNELLIKSTGIKWWQKVLLVFCTPKYGYDWSQNGTTIIEAKTLFGKTYITKEVKE